MAAFWLIVIILVGLMCGGEFVVAALVLRYTY